jgi:hypothetical protein
LIRGYISRGEGIPLENIKKILKQTDLELSRILNRLIGLGLILIKSTLLEDGLIKGSGGILSFHKKDADEYYINNILKIYKDSNLEKTNRFINFKSIASSREITIIFKRALSHLSTRADKINVPELVNYFADKLVKQYNIKRTPEWRRNQYSTAKRLFKSYDFNLEDWKEAIDYFLKQEYWKDKLSTLKQVERNLPQFMANRGKGNKTRTKIRVIE